MPQLGFVGYLGIVHWVAQCDDYSVEANRKKENGREKTSWVLPSLLLLK
jgi:hypothetical protein